VITVFVALLLACPSSTTSPPPEPPAPATTASAPRPMAGPADVGALATQAKAALEAKGFTVTIGTATLDGLGWGPLTEGTSLTVADPTRTMSYTRPYSDATKPEMINPQVEVVLVAASAPITATADQRVRQTPASVFGSVPGAYVLVPQFAVKDDGGTEKAVRDALFGAAATGDVPGVKSVTGDVAKPHDLPADVEASLSSILWSYQDGAMMTLTLVPVGTAP
jgi:hypothetical protein